MSQQRNDALYNNNTHGLTIRDYIIWISMIIMDQYHDVLIHESIQFCISTQIVRVAPQ